MGYGLALSLLMHLSLLAWAVVSFQRTPELVLPEIQTIEASLVTISDVTRLKQGDPDAKQLEAKPKDEPKPDLAKEEAPKPKPMAAPPPPAPAAPPPPAEPEPPKAEAKPPEPAKPAPDPIADKLAQLPPDPAPGPSPEELKRIEEEKKAEEQRKQDEIRKQEERKKEEERKKAEEKKKKLELEKKLAEERRKKEEAKKKFDADKIAALIDKSPEKRGAPQSTPLPPINPTDNTGKAAGEREGKDTVLTAREQDLLKSQINSQLGPCSTMPGGGGGTDTPPVTVRWRLKRDGSLDGEPQVVSAPDTPLGRIAADAAVRAIKKCSPLRLPPDMYAGWSTINWYFDWPRILGLR